MTGRGARLAPAPLIGPLPAHSREKYDPKPFDPSIRC